MRPHIGVSTSFEQDQQRLDLAYVRAIERAGAVPVLLPMVEDAATGHALLDRLDGLVLTGGPAVTDGLIGSVPEDLPLTAPVRRTADALWLREALSRDLPVLGICYGMQLLNAVLGGTLYADVQHQHPGARVHSSVRGGTTHPLHLVEGTALARLLCPSPDMASTLLTVNTRHIQAIAEVAPGLQVSAHAPDGVIEGIERPDGRWIGVQFHPETLGTPFWPLFDHLVHQSCLPAPSS